jgi:ribosomal protein S13
MKAEIPTDADIFGAPHISECSDEDLMAELLSVLKGEVNPYNWYALIPEIDRRVKLMIERAKHIKSYQVIRRENQD